MEEVKNNAGQNLGIAALITAIITFVLAVIPCIGIIAFIPGVIAIILAAVGISQASKNNASKGLPIAGLVIGIVATLISFSWIVVAGKLTHGSGNWENKIQNIVNEVQDNVIKEMGDDNVNIKIQSGDEVIEINAKKKDNVKVLEGLESADSLSNDTTKVKK